MVCFLLVVSVVSKTYSVRKLESAYVRWLPEERESWRLLPILGQVDVSTRATLPFSFIED